MATYYANLDLTGEGGTGISLDPWHADTFSIQANGVLNSNDIIKIQGTSDFGNANMSIYGTGNTPITVESWLPSAPARISCKILNIRFGSTFNNGIVQAYDTFSVQGASIINCFVKTSTPVFVINSNIVKGSTFVCDAFVASDVPIVGSFTDTIIDTPDYYGNLSSISWNNCAFTRATLPGGTATNCQVNWAPPTWPAWNAAQSAFSSTLLSSGILSDPPSGSPGKPNPGNPPYTNYEQGLFNSMRNGIGAMDFGGGITTTTTTEAPTTTAGPTTTTPAPDPIVQHFGGGSGQRKVILDEQLSQLFKRPWGTMADYPYQP